MVAALGAMPVAADGARTPRHTNLANAGAVMSLMDCYLLGLQPNAETCPYRTTSNADRLVVEGDGVSTIGAEAISWQYYDVFTLPAWQWVLHKAIAGYKAVSGGRPGGVAPAPSAA